MSPDDGFFAVRLRKKGKTIVVRLLRADAYRFGSRPIGFHRLSLSMK